jgi:hypothetical protein
VLTADFAIEDIAISAGGGIVRTAINLNVLMLDTLVVFVGIVIGGVVGLATGDIARTASEANALTISRYWCLIWGDFIRRVLV